MTSLPNLSNQMFLDPNIEQYVAHVRVAHAPCCSFAMRLNELAHRSIFAARINAHDLQPLLLVALLHRALTSYQATVMLGERGMPQEAQVMLRTLLEVTFKIVAIAKYPSVGRAFVLEDENHRRKFLEKLKKLSPELQDRDSLSELESLQSAIGNRKNPEVHASQTWWFAQKAGLSDFYNSAYAVLSEEVHSSARTLERALRLDESDNLLGLNYGFSDDELDLHLLTAAEALILSLRATFSIIDVPTAEEIEIVNNELNILRAGIDG